MLLRKYWIALLLALILGCVSGSAGLRVQFATNEFIINRIGQVYTVQVVMDSDEADAMLDLALYSFALKLSFPSAKALAGTNGVIVVPIMDNDGFDTGKARRIAGPGYIGAWGLIGLTNKFYGPSTTAVISPAGTWPLLATFTLTNLASPGESYELTLGRINDTVSEEWTYAEEAGGQFVAFDADLDFGVATVTINSPPTISAIDSQTISLGGDLKPFKFTIGDIETDVGELSINLYSSNPELVSPDEISVEGEGSERILTATVAEGKTGEAKITVTVDDGQLAASTQFHIIVQIPDTRPRFKSVQRVEDNIIRLTIEAQPGTSLSLQASSDCKTWTTLKSVIVDAPLMTMDDWMEDSNIKRFYRLIQ